MKRDTLFARLALAVAAANLISGCESTDAVARVTKQITNGEGGAPYVVATEKTAFYRYGPQQGNGADMELPKETLVNLIRSSFGYSKVQLTSTGERGFVATEDITRASPTLLASLTKVREPMSNDTSPTPDDTSPASSVENFDIRSTDPGLVPPPEDLPPPDLPPTEAEPTP